MADEQLNGILGRMATNGSMLLQQMGQLIQTLDQIFPRIIGTFTMTATATLVVPNTSVAANSLVQLFPSNAAAATLMGGTRSLYVSALSAGVSFTVATASGVAAAGTETFSYNIVNPV